MKFKLTHYWMMLVVALATGCGKPTDPASPEAILNEEKDLAELLRQFPEARLPRTPWAGYWWPYTSDGISEAARKHDAIHRGRAADWEKKQHGRRTPGVEAWWGHCNGWSAASVLFPEPRKSVKSGRTRFDVGDIKALLTEAAMEVEADFFGDRDNPEDVVPNQFLLVLFHYMGRLRQPVLFDRHAGPQVWNHPMVGYRFEPPRPEDYLGTTPEAPAVHRLMLTVRIWWVRDDVKPDTLTSEFSFEDGRHFSSRTLRLEAWTDAPARFDDQGRLESAGDILLAPSADNLHVFGGAWRMGDTAAEDTWPDYLWVPYRVATPTDYANPEMKLPWIEQELLPRSR